MAEGFLVRLKNAPTTLNKKVLHAPRYVWATILTSMGGALFGLDTGTIGPITTMPQFLDVIGELSSSLHGLIVSSILIPAATASFFAGHLADAVGRKKAIAIGTIIFGLGAAIESATVHLAMLICGRIVTGLGEGLFLSTLVVYICEISPPKHRGFLASFPQLIITIGIAGGFFVCYGTLNIESSLSWRIPFALQALVALAVSLSSFFFLPESPRWLSSVGRTADAARTWDHLGVSHTEREKAEETVPAPTSDTVTTTAPDDPTAKRKSNFLRAFGKDVWRRTALGVFLMGFQQLSGIDGVLYYAPLLFRQAGLSSASASFLASGVSALVIFAVTIPATSFSDSWGRRASTITGGLACATCMLSIGALYATDSVHATHGAGRWAVIALIYLFVVAFSATWAVCIKVYASEIQPPATRAAASSLAYSSNWIFNWLVAFTTPVFLARSAFGVYFLFGGATLLAVAVCIVWMPETRRRTLESINESFAKGQTEVSLQKLRSWIRSGKKASDGEPVELRHVPYRTMEDAIVN